MKRNFLIFGMCLCISLISAQNLEKSRFNLTNSANDINVELIKTKQMKEIKPKKNNDLDYQKAYQLKDKNTKGETRFSFFKDLGGDSKTAWTEFYVYSLMIIYNAAGMEIPQNKISVYKPDNVYGEFNGDTGVNVYISNPTSEYAKGYKHLWIDCFYKEDCGILVRTFLFNDLEFIGVDKDGKQFEDNLYALNYDTFKFK